MRTVIIESPFAALTWPWGLRWLGRWCNLRYLRRCMRDSLMRMEAPFASHGLYTQPGVLRDYFHVERNHGIAAGFAWTRHADLVAVYCDRGISSGMQKGIDHARALGKTVEYRTLRGGVLREEEEDCMCPYDDCIHR